MVGAGAASGIVSVVSFRGDRVHLGFGFPREIAIARKEIVDATGT